MTPAIDWVEVAVAIGFPVGIWLTWELAQVTARHLIRRFNEHAGRENEESPSSVGHTP
jgi:hypothetical protein